MTSKLVFSSEFGARSSELMAAPSSEFGARSSELSECETISTSVKDGQKNNSELQTPNSELNTDFGSPKSVFSWISSTNNTASSWYISLIDSSGFTNTPAPASYEVIPDYPANVRLTYPGGNNYTLPTYGHLKTIYEISDDYAISSATLNLQPDNERIPWTSDCEITNTAPHRYQIINDISLGEFMISGAKKIRIWVEVSDNLPPELGGPNISKSRVIAVNLDNRENRSFADQVRIPERDEITNILASATQRLEETAKRLASATNSTPQELTAALETAQKTLQEIQDETQKAAQTAKDGLFAGVSDEIEELKNETVEEAIKEAESATLTDTEEQQQAVEETIQSIEKAAEEAKEIIPQILEKDELLEEASEIEELARKQQALAREAKERQLTDDELDRWQVRQEDLANKIGAMDETMSPDPYSPPMNKSSEFGDRSSESQTATPSSELGARSSESLATPSSESGVQSKESVSTPVNDGQKDNSELRTPNSELRTAASCCARCCILLLCNFKYPCFNRNN